MDDRFTYLAVPAHTPQASLSCAVLEGLSSTSKSLPSRFFYDRTGSELFEKITNLPEYYLTRTEQAILDAHGGEMIEAVGKDLSIVELGSGSSRKTRVLIEQALLRQEELAYFPIDISTEFLRESAEVLLSRYPQLRVHALAGEYSDAIACLPETEGPRLILFLGSNIGNFVQEEAKSFLAQIRSFLRQEDRLLVGVDLVKEPSLIESAYNDGSGVTEGFNKNVLRRINQELHGSFDLARFRHHAPYDATHRRVGMHLVSDRTQQVNIDSIDAVIELKEGEAIHTEWSHKYTPGSFRRLAAEAGFGIAAEWRDDRDWFCEFLLRCEG